MVGVIIMVTLILLVVIGIVIYLIRITKRGARNDNLVLLQILELHFEDTTCINAEQYRHNPN